MLKGTASVGPQSPPTALDMRLNELPPLEQPVILRDLKVGQRTQRVEIRMDADQHMGDALSLLAEPEAGEDHRAFALVFRHRTIRGDAPIVPWEMVSVLLQYVARQDGLQIRGPAVGLFADQEIRMIDGPLFVGEDYEIEREIVALSGSRRTEMLLDANVRLSPGRKSKVIATMLLNQATLKDSYAPYAAEQAELYPRSD